MSLESIKSINGNLGVSFNFIKTTIYFSISAKFNMGYIGFYSFYSSSTLIIYSSFISIYYSFTSSTSSTTYSTLDSILLSSIITFYSYYISTTYSTFISSTFGSTTTSGSCYSYGSPSAWSLTLYQSSSKLSGPSCVTCGSSIIYSLTTSSFDSSTAIC